MGFGADVTALTPWELPATIAAALIALGVIGRSIYWAYGWANKIDESLEYVRKELTFNGGSTMRDGQARMEKRLDNIEANQAEVAAELQEFRRTSTANQRHVGESVSTLLEHDAERDQPGLRYENPSKLPDN